MTPNNSYNRNEVNYYRQEALFLDSFPRCSDAAAMLDDRSELATFSQEGCCIHKIDQDQENTRQRGSEDCCESAEAMMERHYAKLERNRAYKDYSTLNENELQEIEALNDLESHFKRIDSFENLNKMGKTRRSTIRRRRRTNGSDQSNEKLQVDCRIAIEPISILDAEY